MIRWLSRDRTGNARPAGRTPPAVAGVPPQEMPPRPPLSAWNTQRGVHDPVHDPCGAPPIPARGRA